MKKRKWLRGWIPLVLAFLMAVGPVAAVGAEEIPTVEVSDVQDGVTEATEELLQESAEESLQVSAEESAETLREEEAAEETPYQELLEEENLIIVTVDENSSPSGQISMEAVEDLSEPELQALEDYIEEQGYPVSRAAMLASVPDTEVRTITFSMDGFLSLELEGYGSGLDAVFTVHPANYQGNCNAYCIDPSVQAPGHDIQKVQKAYTTTVRDYRDPLLLKILYYGFGGPEDLTASFASTPTARHILTHMAATRRAAELGIPGSGDYKYRANSTAIAKADALYETIRAQEDIAGTASVLTPVQGHQTLLLLANYVKPEKEVPDEPATTDLTVRKTVSGSGGNKNTEFHFVLKLTSSDGISLPAEVNGRKPDLREENAASWYFTLHHGQEICFTKLPAGLDYSVEETDGAEAGYTVKAEHASGKLSDEPVLVTYLNSREMLIPTGADTNEDAMAGLMMASASLLLTAGIRKREKKPGHGSR